MVDDAPARKLAAILHADVVGYSRLMGEDEDATHRIVRHHCDAISAKVREHRGNVVHCIGDAVLADFATVTDALGAAVAIQHDPAIGATDTGPDPRVRFRVGVHLGEVIVDGDEIYGDGVNVAVRLEGLAEPGGICVSEAVRSAVGTKLPIAFEFLGDRNLKNIKQPSRAYRVVAANSDRDVAPPCPYPGMVPFGPADAPYFYGREVEIARMVQLLRRQRFMMVIGPSGSGKSSLVHAGLLPELENNRYFTTAHWLIRTMRPGAQPSDRLAETLGRNDGKTDIDSEVIDDLLGAHPPAEQLLLLVDQFEEVFTQAEREERLRFFATLQSVRQIENCALILTLRADFYPELMTSPLWPIDASQRVEVAPLRGETLREAIQRPAADVGVRIEERLVSQLLDDAADEPGVLPLLQETMRLLWDDVESRLLPFSAYERLRSVAHDKEGRPSGLAVAIAMKADAALAELSPSQQAIARRIFLRLVQFGEGRADTRRQQPVSSLHSADDAISAFESTLEHLTDHRLLTRSGGLDGHPPKVDIAHEALIRGWSRLQGWVSERRDAEQTRRRLEDRTSEWTRLGKKSGGLLDHTALAEAELWLDSVDASDLGIGAALLDLVEASRRSMRWRRIGLAASLAPVMALLGFITWISAEGSYPVTAVKFLAAKMGFGTLLKPEMVEISAGAFMMGPDPDDELGQAPEYPRHPVTVPAFAIGKYEVTFAEWDDCFAAGGCSHRPEDEGWGRDRRPEINVSWDDAQEYVTWLSGLTGETYRLPSEAEWEYALRAGTTTRYATGDALTAEDANFGVKDGQTKEVGTYPPNAFGLHDMHGNAMEWVWDRYSESYEGAPDDGSAWEDGLDTLQRVLRGGSWGALVENPRAAFRMGRAADNRNDDFGFRVAKPLEPREN